MADENVIRRYDAVVFDIGETLLDRTREYAAWAEFFGVPAHTFSAVFGALIARGETVFQVLEFFGDSSPEELFARRAAVGDGPVLDERDLYPDVRESIAELRSSGFVVGVAGNQPSSTSEQLRALDLGADFVGSSSEWGVSKPKPEFFERIARECGTVPGRVVYVGDQIENDILAPQRAGLASVRIIRGPWGYLTRDADAEAGCLAVVESLLDLREVLEPAT